MNINAERLWKREMSIGEYGRDKRGGISRLAWTPEYKEAAEVLIRWMEEIDLKVRIDAVGNIYGRYEGTEDLAPILIGSHLDTVPMGGKFDGLAGVMTALEVLTSMREKKIQPTRPIEMIAFINEEASQFLGGHFGSKAICGILPHDYFDKTCDKTTGKTLRQAMAEYGMGLNPDNLAASIIKEDDYFAFIELHIEQGRYLLDKNLPMAIVEDIAGIRQFYITYYGESAHAGGMAMEDRHDALAAAAATACEVEKLALNSGSTTRGTVGYFFVEPGEHNIIAKKGTLSVDFREVKDDIWKSLYDHLIDFVENQCEQRGLTYSVNSTICTAPCHCNNKLKEIIKESANENNLPFTHMVSYPAHDAMQMGRLYPMAMIFLRSSNGGVSHCPDEYTTKEDLSIGAETMFFTTQKLCSMRRL